MTKLFLIFLILGLSGYASAQGKYIDRAGKASFFSAALVEDIEAHNSQVVSIVDLESGELVASMLMKSFNFKKALMQEHFNENYVESNKYPKATFKGRITNFDKFDVSVDNTYTWAITGSMTLHGVTKPLTLNATAVVSNGIIRAEAQFPLLVKDFKIKIPPLVRNNIAEQVEVSVSFEYQPMQNSNN